MNMKGRFAVVCLLFGRFLTGFVAAVVGDETNPYQQYAKEGTEAVLQCGYAHILLIWSRKVNDVDGWKVIATGNAINGDRYNVSVVLNSMLYQKLHVLHAQPEDELTYRCSGGPSASFYYIQLTLYSAPTSVNFNGSMNKKLEGTEGTNLQTTCVAVGGKPPPNVTILNDTMSSGIQKVSYTISGISRNFHQKSLVCQAKNDAIVNPITTTVQIYLELKPLTPFFEQDQISTKETETLIVSCKSYGSRPAASFKWIIDGNDVTSSSSISQTHKEPNETNTVTSTLTSSVNRSHDNKIIICEAYNTIGNTIADKTLDVKYAPDIKVSSPTFTPNDAIRTVTCNASGNPNSYIYHKWQQKSKYGELIREFAGNKTLKLPVVTVLKRYQDSGKYVCIASNGVKDRYNNVEQNGYGYVTVKAKPVFTINRVKQFGEVDTAVDIYVNVYSLPKFTSVKWTRNGKVITTQNSKKYKSSSSPTIVRDKINDKEVQLDGYNVTLTISDSNGEDFTNYTVTLENTFGSSAIYTIVLESASRPDIPGNFSSIASSATIITVHWDPNSGGGYKQTFYIQYRVQGSSEWTIVSAGEEDLNEQRRRRTYEVTNLQGGTAYELRMFAENIALKRSNFTKVLIELTRSSDAESSTGAVIGGVAGSLIAIIIVLLVVVCVLKKRKERATPSMKLRTSSEAGKDDGLKDNILYESSQSDGLKTNALYQSAGPDFESQNKTSTSSDYAVVQKPNAIYAEVNKDAQHKNVKEKKQKNQKEKTKKDKKVKAKAVKNNPEDEYANSALPLQTLNEGEYANSTDAQGPSGHHTNAQGLEYADLTFRQIPAKNKKQVIHGNDERTLYADVDHTKKAPPPPPESEYEETNIKHGKIA